MSTRSIIEPNAPGLTAVRYRPARHAEVKAAMVRALSDARRPGLQALGARDDEDLTIALLDAFAAVADSVGFYVERSAREAWLRTAEERLSIRLLARLVGYELRPAIAASALLAFELEAAEGAPSQLSIEPGLQVQSVPGPGADGLPQTFETIEPLVARPIWNAIPPRLFAPQDVDAEQPDASASARWIAGVGVDVRPGRPVIHVHVDDDATVLAAHEGHFLRRIARAVVEREHGRTRIEFEPPPGAIGSSVFQLLGMARLPMFVSHGRGRFFGRAGELEIHQRAQFVSPPAPPPPDPNGPGVYVMEVSAPLFAHDRVPKNDRNGLPDGPGDNASITLASENQDPDEDACVHLDAVYEQIAAGTWIVLSANGKEAAVRVHSRTDLSLARYGISRRVTRLDFLRADLTRPDGTAGALSDFPIVSTTVHAVPRLLPMIDLPIADPIGFDDEGTSTDTIELDALYLDLEPGKRVVVTGMLGAREQDLAGVTFSEARTIVENDRSGDRSLIRLDQPLERQYVRATVRICANVALATHGERTVEPIASGEAITPFKPIALKKKPVTFTPAPTPTGGATTLKVWVDGVEWQQVADFSEAGPDDRVYAARESEQGVTSVVFGDGATGALPASRTENVVAEYRAGAGAAGRVKAGALSLLKSRPQGVKGVVNPLPAAGGADGEAIENARENAPLHALTLGRVVSLRDYEDAARAFGPIGKARADWVWAGTQRSVFLTVAGEDGDPLAGSPVIADLEALLRQSGDLFVPLRIAEYQPAFFTLAARVAIGPGRRFEDVRKAVEAALRERFGFAARRFGEAVTRSEVIATIQGVEGVDHVDLDLLHPVSAPPANLPFVAAAAPVPGERGEVAPAELLTLTPDAFPIEPLP